jgi:Zn-dependent peptidase ImmA (M78 family)
VRAGTVLINSLLLLPKNKTRRRFTCAHEGSHWILHRSLLGTGKWNSEYTAAKKEIVSGSINRPPAKNELRMEGQADFLGAAILMPRTTLRIFFRGFCEENDIKPRKLVRNADDGELVCRLISDIAERYNVSLIAARIRLEKLGVIVKDE